MLRIGSRGSALALAQSRTVAAALEAATGAAPEIVVVETRGDRDRTSALPDFGGTGAFTREIDEQQREGLFDVSVHSLKDLPTTGREGLVLAAVPERAPVEDCVVSRHPGGLDGLPRGATLGTGSERRRAQARVLRPDLDIVPIRGNVETRIAKVRDGAVDATLLARAGLLRLGREDDAAEVLTVDRMVPAASQGALAIVVREDAADALAACRALEHTPSRAEVDAERAVLRALGGGCHLPLGVLARTTGERLELRARVVSADGSRTLEDTDGGPVGDAAEVGQRLGRRLVEAGARELIG